MTRPTTARIAALADAVEAGRVPFAYCDVSIWLTDYRGVTPGDKAGLLAAARAELPEREGV